MFFELPKEDQAVVEQLVNILKDCPAFLERLQKDKSHYCVHMTNEVKDIITSWIEAKQKSEDDYHQELNRYVTFFTLNDKQKNNLKWLWKLCEEDPSYRDKIINKYEQGKVLPEEQYALEYLFGYQKPADQKQKSQYVVRDYSSDFGIAEVIMNIQLGKFIRQQLQIPDGIITEEQEPMVAERFSLYCTLFEDKIIKENCYITEECMNQINRGDLEAFEKKWVHPHISNVSCSYLFEKYMMPPKPPYQK